MLRGYQEKISDAALDLLNEYKIAYLSMQVRTGKTITAFATAKKFGAKSVLFITKKKAINSVRKDYFAMFNHQFELWTINYESAHKFEYDFDFVILDEAHCLGQFPKPSLRAKKLKEMIKLKPIIYLSGTPTPESYSQIYHQFWVSSFSPFLYPKFYDWAKHFVTPQNKYIFNRTIIDYSNANKEKIDAVCKHLFISYTQEEAGFKEDVIEKVHRVRMKDKIYHICDRLRKDKVVKGADNFVILADTEVKLLNKLHQLFSGTCIVEHELTEEAKYTVIDETKVEYIFDTFKGKKIAIFYKFKSELSMIINYVDRNGLKYTISPEEFNSNSDMVFVSQFVSGREGINLSSADALICMNIDYSAVTYLQVRARLQTKDRETPAEVHWIFAENGIEHDIYNRVKNKENYTLHYFKKSFYNDADK
jgi:hypothetical protein